MYTFARFYILKTFALVLYYIGDVASRLPFEWSANLYQATMNKSYDIDERIGFVLWKEI
jgi:hypothetical protein